MQNEYKSAMEKISLSDSDKVRILANVKAGSGEQSEKVTAMTMGRPRFSKRKMAAVAAALLVICASAGLIRGQFIGRHDGESSDISESAVPTEQAGFKKGWQKLDSLEDIAQKTDCRTYTLGNIKKKYKVKKVEVENDRRHVKITYQSRKNNDKILFEYQEEENAQDITRQFNDANEIMSDTVGTSEVTVTMYGAEKCDGMTWQEESCTFAVRMSRASSIRQAKKLVCGLKRKKNDKRNDEGKSYDDRIVKTPAPSANPNAIGWQGREPVQAEEEQQDVLRQIYYRLGFRIFVGEPAEDIVYKKVGDFESFAFYYRDDVQLSEYRIIGYAGWEGCPEGVMSDCTETDAFVMQDVSVTVYRKENDEKLFRFVKEEITFTIIVEGWKGEEYAEVMEKIMAVFRISMDKVPGEMPLPQSSAENTSSKPKATKVPEAVDSAVPTLTPKPSSTPNAVLYREQAKKIQEAAAEKNTAKLAAFMQFPITVQGMDITIGNAEEWEKLSGRILTDHWIDAVVSQNTDKIKEGAANFTLGGRMYALLCRIEGDTVTITEIRAPKAESENTQNPVG